MTIGNTKKTPVSIYASKIVRLGNVPDLIHAAASEDALNRTKHRESDVRAVAANKPGADHLWYC